MNDHRALRVDVEIKRPEDRMALTANADIQFRVPGPHNRVIGDLFQMAQIDAVVIGRAVLLHKGNIVQNVRRQKERVIPVIFIAGKGIVTGFSIGAEHLLHNIGIFVRVCRNDNERIFGTNGRHQTFPTGLADRLTLF